MMGSPKSFSVVACLCILVGLVGVISPASATSNFTDSDLKNIANALNLEYFEAEYFLWASYGFGLDTLAPSLTGNGPKPIGVQKANLDAHYTDVFKQMGLQEIGHIRYHDRSIANANPLTHPLWIHHLLKQRAFFCFSMMYHHKCFV
jgi:hypothetical protein